MVSVPDTENEFRSHTEYQWIVKNTVFASKALILKTQIIMVKTSVFKLHTKGKTNDIRNVVSLAFFFYFDKLLASKVQSNKIEGTPILKLAIVKVEKI